MNLHMDLGQFLIALLLLGINFYLRGINSSFRVVHKRIDKVEAALGAHVADYRVHKIATALVACFLLAGCATTRHPDPDLTRVKPCPKAVITVNQL